jgi:hypothetical protein
LANVASLKDEHSCKSRDSRVCQIQQVNRQLETEGRAIRKARGRVSEQLGKYFIVSNKRVEAQNIVLEHFAREQGCLEAWESVRDE